MRKNNAEPTSAVTISPIKPLPNQKPLPFDAEAAARQAALFDDGRDLPGAGEREQRIIWDVAAPC